MIRKVDVDNDRYLPYRICRTRPGFGVFPKNNNKGGGVVSTWSDESFASEANYE